jgi:Ser/Thr protein kinase RdoA (MazF antagonist)
MGRMHALAKGYDAARTVLPDWREERDSFAAWCWDEAVRIRWLELGQELEGLPTDADGYGLIHNDLHPQNFLVAGDRLTVIDFDVAGYHWFAMDVGIALFHAVWLGPRHEEERVPFAAHFMRRFLAGYEQENRLAPEWLVRLPQFLRYRRILLYIAFTESGEEWFRGQAASWRADILADRPVVAWHHGA